MAVFTLPARHFNFPDISITTDTFRQYKFSGKVYGPADNDGVTSFPKTIEHAAALDVTGGSKLLFLPADGMSGRDILHTFAGHKFVDPDILWSLLGEPEHKTLKYLCDTYGVCRILSLRRTFMSSEGAAEYALCLYVKRGKWTFEFYSVNTCLSSGEVILMLK